METKVELEKQYEKATIRLMKAEKKYGSLLPKELTLKNIMKIEKARQEAQERSCLEMYGDAYREYMDRTPRWIGMPKSSK
jgi:hypothetical protein